MRSTRVHGTNTVTRIRPNIPYGGGHFKRVENHCGLYTRHLCVRVSRCVREPGPPCDTAIRVRPLFATKTCCVRTDEISPRRLSVLAKPLQTTVARFGEICRGWSWGHAGRRYNVTRKATLQRVFASENDRVTSPRSFSTSMDVRASLPTTDTRDKTDGGSERERERDRRRGEKIINVFYTKPTTCVQ